jgi:oligopeptide/dipeptide ABC transporter ATP-binding protein
MKTGQSSQPLLEVRELRTSFSTEHGSVPVLDEISFSLNRGETLGIVGESGSGKSILGLSIIRLLPRSARIESGSILLDGVDLVELRERELNAIRGRDIGVVFQDPVSSLNPMRRVGAQIAEALLIHSDMSRGEAFARARELLEEVQIPRAAERLRSYPHELSGGMCQRVMIAIAIAASPRLILADEPTTALDASIEAQVLALLSELQAAHEIAMIFISHDVSVVAHVADRVAVMYAGEFVEVAEARELFSNPQHPYTEGLVASAPRLRGGERSRHTRLATLPGKPPRLGDWPKQCRFAPRCPYAGDDECVRSHLELREVAPGHWARSAHPRLGRPMVAAYSRGVSGA